MEDDKTITAPRRSLLEELDEKAAAKEDKENDERYLQEAVDALTKGAPVIGERPWSNYVEPATGSDDHIFVKGNVERNLLPLSHKIVPLPMHAASNKMKDEFDQMAIADSHRIATAPMIAHALYMFTPSLLILLMANPSASFLKDLRQSCLDVARRWKASQDERERASLVQNLIELQGIYETDKGRVEMECRDERVWPARTNAIEVIAQYRRAMNMIRLTNGFAGIDEDYAAEMAALIHKCDRHMAHELQQLSKRASFKHILEPLIKQIRATGSVYDLREVDVAAFQSETINFTVEFVRIMELWLLRVAAPHAHERFYFYHMSSVQIPDQEALTQEERSCILHMRKVGQHAQSTYDPMLWPEYNRCRSPFNSPPASLKWPSKEHAPLPQVDRVTTANNIVACARLLTQKTFQEDIRWRAVQAFEMLVNDNYAAWGMNQSVILLPNSECPTGQEYPEILMGNPEDIF